MPDASTLTNFTSHAATLCYLLAAASLYFGKGHFRFALLAGFTGFALHLANLALALWHHHTISGSFFDAISLTSLIVVATTLTNQWKRPTTVVLGPLFLFASICVLLTGYFGEYRSIEASSRGALIHILASITAYSLLCVAALYALLLLVTVRKLKHLSSGFADTLPPLQDTEKTLFQMIVAGWVALSIAILSGFIFIEDFFAQHLAHKTVFSVFSWLVFGTLLAGHQLQGWRGAKAAKWTLAGFSALLLAYLGSKFVLDVVLGVL